MDVKKKQKNMFNFFFNFNWFFMPKSDGVHTFSSKKWNNSVKYINLLKRSTWFFSWFRFSKILYQSKFYNNLKSIKFVCSNAKEKWLYKMAFLNWTWNRCRETKTMMSDVLWKKPILIYFYSNFKCLFMPIFHTLPFVV